MVKKNIIGYELVKNATKVEGYERCGYGLLFAMRRGSEDCIEGLCEVRENTAENRAEMATKYPFDDGYYIWSGEVVEDTIRFYWS